MFVWCELLKRGHWSGDNICSQTRRASLTTLPQLCHNEIRSARDCFLELDSYYNSSTPSYSNVKCLVWKHQLCQRLQNKIWCGVVPLKIRILTICWIHCIGYEELPRDNDINNCWVFWICCHKKQFVLICLFWVQNNILHSSFVKLQAFTTDYHRSECPFTLFCHIWG